MSETEEGFFYDLYSFTKSVYIFSHMKTNLVDIYVQYGEIVALIILMIMATSIHFIVLLKILIIFVYILFLQATIAIYKFIKLVWITKFDISIKTNMKYCGDFLLRVFKRIFTYNFYIFKNKIISAFMILIFIITVVSNNYFFYENFTHIKEKEKGTTFLVYFFLCFEFNLLIEIICIMFYSKRNIFFVLSLSLGYFILLNIIILFSHFYAFRKEYLDGAFMYEEPQRLLNIIIFLILMILKINCLFQIKKYKKESK